MDAVELYRLRAAECEKLATTAISDDHRQRILELAASWLALANQREALLQRLDMQSLRVAARS